MDGYCEIQLSPVENGGKDPIIYRVSACFDHPRWCRISQRSTVCFNWTVSLMPLPKHGQVVREAVTLVSKFFLQNLQTLQRRCALQLDGTLASEKATGKPDKNLCFRTLWSIIKYLHYGPCSDSELGVTQRPPAFGGNWHDTWCFEQCRKPLLIDGYDYVCLYYPICWGLSWIMHTGWGVQDSVQLRYKWLNCGLWMFIVNGVYKLTNITGGTIL